MDRALVRVRGVVTLALAVLYLVNVFLKSGMLENINVILVVIVLIPSLLLVTGITRIIGYSFFMVSAILLFYSKAPLSVWEQALEENLYLVVLFVTVPLLSIPIRSGGYFESLQALFQRYVTSTGRFYLFVSFLSAMVGVLVNMAIVPLMHEISRASEISKDKRLLSSAISRGFATCTLWAPTTAAIALILKLTGAKWLAFFPLALLLGCVAGIVGFVMTVFEERGREAGGVQAPTVSQAAFNWRKVIELCVFGILLIISIAVISLTTGIPTVIIVALAALLFPVLWLGVIGRLSILSQEFVGDYLNESLPKLKNELVLFLGAGLMGASITYSHLGDYVPQLLTAVVGHNAFLFVSVVFFSTLILSALGVHPIVIITVVGSTVSAAAYGLSPTFMALILSMCWAMGVSISPASGTVIAVAGLAERSPLTVGIKWNGPYVLIASSVLLILMFLLRTLGMV